MYKYLVADSEGHIWGMWRPNPETDEREERTRLSREEVESLIAGTNETLSIFELVPVDDQFKS